MTALRIGLAAAAWLMFLGAGLLLDLSLALVAFGVAVVVPLGIALAESSYPARASALVRIAMAVGAPLGLASFIFAPGTTSAILAGAWLLATIPGALLGLSRLLGRPECSAGAKESQPDTRDHGRCHNHLLEYDG